MIHGVINVKKERGFTSHDVVAKLRGITRQKKIGHTGTLDPDATGVLPVCLGKATKICDLLTDQDKTYQAVLLLGVTTDTLDITGKVLSRHAVDVSETEVRKAVLSFLGEYKQIPPMYSALKVNGQKLCDLARQGKEVERKARKVVIHDIRIHKVELPRVTIEVSCSKGTYIRSLCQDIGEHLETGGCMEALVRTKVGRFSLEDSHTLGEIEECFAAGELQKWLVPIDEMFERDQKAVVCEAAAKLLLNGNPLPGDQLSLERQPKDGEEVRVYDQKQNFCALYRYQKKESRFKLVKMFYDREG